MPRVSEEHLEARRRQIVLAAAGLVSTKGVHATSMRDVIAASGMSAGAVYHYFPTKASIMEAIGDHTALRYRDGVATLAEAPEPPGPAELVEAIATAVTSIDTEGVDLSSIGIAMWAEALVDERVGATLRRVIDRLRTQLTTVAVRWKAAGRLPEDADPEAVAVALYSLLPGYVLQARVTGDVRPQTLAAGLTALLGYREPADPPTGPRG